MLVHQRVIGNNIEVSSIFISMISIPNNEITMFAILCFANMFAPSAFSLTPCNPPSDPNPGTAGAVKKIHATECHGWAWPHRSHHET